MLKMGKKTSFKADETEGMKFMQVLSKLGLKDKYPGKISMRDVIAVEPNESAEQEKQHISFDDIPWLLLKRLISAHSECRDITATDEESTANYMDLESTMSFNSDIPEENQDISPLDVFIVVFLCCDPLMKQIFVQKLYLCKFAVPFLNKQWETQEIHQPVLSVWPLRSLTIANITSASKIEVKSKEVDVLELPTKVLGFARFGRPRYSKSKLINSLLTNQGCKTFFNIDCISGMTPRYLSNGQIEMFWLPTIGDKKDKFQEAMTFFNMRGDINEHFSEDVLSFIANFVDAFVIIIDSETVLRQRKAVQDAILKFQSVILILASPVRQDVLRKQISNFRREVHASNPEINLRVLSTHKGDVELNVVDMVSSMTYYITEHLKLNETRSFQDRFECAKSEKVKTDEDDEYCQLGKMNATRLITEMKQNSEPERWKQVLTPVHSTYTKQIGELMKRRERERDFAEGEKLHRDIKIVRQTQTKNITKTAQLFIDILMANEKSDIRQKYFLSWLNFHIEREKRQILPKLMHENRCAWKSLEMLKSKKRQNHLDIETQKTVIIELEQKIDDASFSVQHFFREIGHIYEAILELKENSTKFRLPPLSSIANVIGHLVADGLQFELISGESFYMPFLWTKTVLQQVDRCINSCKVMTLSVLGLQSSGKSTLLNTMFGSQFSTRTGRCTRGIHLQLIPTKIEGTEGTSQFNYVLVADTEGLRSPRLSHIQHNHDNELATIITGIGDITLLNIMGENSSEIRDILQVIVHALLRLKMINKKLDIRKCCAFIHQNVTDISASQNMIDGLSKLMQTLDEMTEESAKSEGILEITTFSQVIEFDINSLVWYLKNLWQGNPPMARVNNEYSERVVDIKCKIIQKALNMKGKSYKSLNDVIEQTYNLWKGVLNEDFVFSFRNSLEIRAYMEMERHVQGQLWHLESFIWENLIKETQSCFATCDQKEKLRSLADTLDDKLRDMLAEEKNKTEGDIMIYFETNKYKDIIIQWKSSQQHRIDNLCQKLENIIRQQIEKSQMKRSVEILTVTSQEKHEEELRKRSMDVANKYKGQSLERDQIYKLFDDIWRSFIPTFDTTSSASEMNSRKIKSIFETCLKNIFKKDHVFLKEALETSNCLEPLTNLNKLGGSFGLTRIDERDISFTWQQTGTDNFRINTMDHVTIRVNQIFESVDGKIKSLCQVNDEITEMNVNKLMHELDTSIHAILTGNSKYDFKTPFYVKIYVHVSRYCHPVFERHNEKYFKTNGAAARLEQYKQQQKISFEAHLKCCTSEVITAKLFSHVIESCAEEWTSQSLPNKVTDNLFSHLPSVKSRVIIEICSDLLEKDNFENFIWYLHAPNEYASFWITQKANNHLFGRESRSYADIATNLLNKTFDIFEKYIRDLRHTYDGKPPPTIENWIEDLLKSLKSSIYSIPAERLWHLKMEIKYIQNVAYFTDEILANMVESRERVIAKFRQQESGSLKWADFNPIDRIIKKIWGCAAECPFCGEPCAKDGDHNGSDHYSIQHKPTCGKGVRDNDSSLACLESCGFQIKSNLKHSCQVFNYICNKGTRKECGKTHYFRDYRTYFPDWDISPTSNMLETSKFWLWFVATYKNDLQNRYNYRVDNIPSSWNEITKDEAKESLQKTYSA